jgi:hypothetical protein
MVIDLGEWNPELISVSVLMFDWEEEIKHRLPTFHREDQNVRNPEDHKNLHKNIYLWHRDCNGRQILMLIWANHNPTDIKGEITLPKHIYLLENDLHFHRTPEIVKSDPDRWFCRALGTMPYVS